MRLSTYGLGLALGLSVSAALAQTVGPQHDFKPGDLITLGPNIYPAGGVFRIVSCEPAAKAGRQCEVIRQSPDPETHTRPLTLENYPALALAGRAAPPAATAPPISRAAPSPVASAPPAAGGSCPQSPYGGPVPGSRPASPALFQQKITDSITMGAYGRFWYGVRLTNFSVGAAIRNTIGALPGGGASRVNNGAPPNALMYPVSTTMSVCDGAPAGSSSWRTSQKKYFCFVSANNEWTCAATN